MDSESIAAALLHDVVEDTDATIDDIKREFGDEVALLVDGVTKIGRLNFTTKEQQQAESLRKMLIAMGQDIRVIIIKLADRLHNMRTIDAVSYTHLLPAMFMLFDKVICNTSIGFKPKKQTEAK